MKKIYLALFVLATAISFAQETGTIQGKLTDKELNDEPLVFGNILIKGTSLGTTSDFDGLYEFNNLEPGTYTLEISFLGYETITAENIVVKAGEITKADFSLGASQGMALEEVVVVTTTSKESEAALLVEQKNAVAMSTAIGSQELAKKGVGDAATAVTKTTGVSKQEGSGTIFVRGLGDRYNMTTLNKLPLPSNNPSRKNIELGMFTTDIVEYIGIDKTFIASNYGDFSGANINIKTKDFKGTSFINISLGSGVNTEVSKADTFYLNDGPNKSGFYYQSYPLFPLNNYNFTTSWDRTIENNPINRNASLKGGLSFYLGENTKVNFFGMASHDNNFSYQNGIVRGGITVSGLARRDFTYDSFKYNTNSTAMGTIGVRHLNHFLQFNSLYTNTSSQSQNEYYGVVDAFDYAPEGGAVVQRSVFDRTVLLVNQLLGEHQLSDTFAVNWGTSFNITQNVIPDRRQTMISPDNWDNPEGPKSFQQTLNSSDNHRFFQNLSEEEFAANFEAAYKFKKNEDDLYDGILTFGYNGRMKSVDFKATQFNFRITRRLYGAVVDQPIVENVHNLDSYFNLENRNAGLFSIETFRGNLNTPSALVPQTYDGTQNIHAAYTNLTYKLSDKTTAVVGLRAEKIDQTINWSTSLDPTGGTASFNATEFLPTASIKVALKEDQNLKLAASKTYTLPQFKERALFQYEDVTQVSFGNPSLYASTDYNFDAKWELFPKRSELISVGGFAKYIQNPINDVTVNSATNDLSYVNTGDSATVFGVEFETRKDLINHETETESGFLKTLLTFGFNASYLISNQELDAQKVIDETTAAGILPLSVDFTNSSDKLTGASDLLLNADISFSKEFEKDRNLSATAAYNYYSDRIYALGTEGKGNLVDKGLGSLDLIVKSDLTKNLSLGLSAKNILNPEVLRIQDIQNIEVLSYKRGATVKLSLSYNF